MTEQRLTGVRGRRRGSDLSFRQQPLLLHVRMSYELFAEVGDGMQGWAAYRGVFSPPLLH